MSKLSREQILKLAKLSRLSLTEDEITKYQTDLNRILEYVERLESVDTEGLEPTYQVTGLENAVRDDSVSGHQATTEELISMAPRSQDGYIKVGRMI